MSRPLARSHAGLAALLLGAALPAFAEKSVPTPKADPRKDPIADACAAEAVKLRLDDPATDPNFIGPPVNPAPKRKKDAQKTANRLGAGVESEPDDKGQTLSWKRGGTPAQCRTKLARLQRDFSGRVTFEPTTVTEIAAVRARRNERLAEHLKKKAADPNGAMFDGSKNLLGGLFSPVTNPPSGPAVAAGAAAPGPRAVPASYAPSVQLPLANRRSLSYSVPETAVNYSAPTFTQQVVGAYEATTAYVSTKISEAGEYLTGVGRTVRNAFYSGVEMIQGYGYKFIHAGRRNNWGTQPLVDGLRKIAAYMRGAGRADTDIAIGDISSAHGGQLGGHASHQTGRDVDIGYYMTDENGAQVEAQGFVRFNSGKDGLTGYAGGRKVRFDAQRNWFLVQAILANNDPAFRPTYIFINPHLENAVLAAAGDSPERGRAAELMRPWPGHDNHLHLRVQ